MQNGGPAKAQRSGVGGERRSSGTTELLPLKAKRRMWSLRRRDGPKSRKLHYGELVGRGHVSPHPKHYPRGSNGDRNPLGLSFSPIFLQTKKDGATGGRQLPSAAGKKEKRKMSPPKAESQAERPRKYHALQVNSLTGPQDFISTSTSAGPEALPLPSFLTMTVTIPLSPLPVPLWK